MVFDEKEYMKNYYKKTKNIYNNIKKIIVKKIKNDLVVKGGNGIKKTKRKY